MKLKEWVKLIRLLNISQREHAVEAHVSYNFNSPYSGERWRWEMWKEVADRMTVNNDLQLHGIFAFFISMQSNAKIRCECCRFCDFWFLSPALLGISFNVFLLFNAHTFTRWSSKARECKMQIKLHSRQEGWSLNGLHFLTTTTFA